MRRNFDPTLCLVIGPDDTRGRDPLWVAGQALEGGVTTVQLRWKGAAADEYAALARELATLARRHGATLIVNDHPEIAAAVAADGVHVGQSDAAPAAARRIVGAEAIVGLSIENPGQVAGVDAGAVDYLGVGPIFATSTKPDAAPALGAAGLSAIHALTRLPIIAIGSVSEKNAGALRAAGADGLAVVSAICAAEDPKAAAAAIRSAFGLPRFASG